MIGTESGQDDRLRESGPRGGFEKVFHLWQDKNKDLYIGDFFAGTRAQ